MRTPIGAWFMGLASLCGCLVVDAGSSADEADWGGRLGVAERHGEHVCLATTGAVKQGQSIHLVSPFEPQTIAKAEIVETDSALCRDASESLLPPGNFHRLGSPGLEELALPAIALLDPQATVVVTDDLAHADVDDDGPMESFRACTSREGIHLTVWSGSPLSGQRRWHHYYYLGYDTESTCDERDYRGSVD